MRPIKSQNSMVNIIPIKAFTDNYIWAITRASQPAVTALVDPGDANVCINFLEENQLRLCAMLVTHHHQDHTGGIKALLAYCQQKKWPITVYGSASEHTPCCDIALSQNDIINITELDLHFKVIEVPGHTAGHIAYFCNETSEPILFSGDTLFSAGCGRLFEGTAAQMLNSLGKLASLPDHTQVYCTHEYTQANLNFARTVDPKNKALINYRKKVKKLRATEQITLPSSIQLEKEINPFLRSHMTDIKISAQQFDPQTANTELSVFTTIRRWKDQF